MFTDRGVNSADVLQRELSIKEFEDVDGLKYMIIKTYGATAAESENIYEAIRKYWIVNLDRANECPYVVGAVNNIVRGVYEVQEWKLTSNPQYKGRKEFTGIEAPDEIQNLFLGKRLPSHYTGQPSIRYHDQYSGY